MYTRIWFLVVRVMVALQIGASPVPDGKKTRGVPDQNSVESASTDVEQTVYQNFVTEQNLMLSTDQSAFSSSQIGDQPPNSSGVSLPPVETLDVADVSRTIAEQLL